ncbi:hypothetical protein AALP_AAs67984U000100 [Arabis alpina]|uniref:Uncharacterized protein n=1 Tax=Arabis alpina TaxID=50452 RepID=A0A087FYJ7_ARAAL|nr:hypothetical protein AALP_AAs67984U000100 [Arabis alpina]
MAQRKVEGLCFRCDEKWHIRHQCPKKEVDVLLVQENGPNFLWEADDDFTDATDQAITELAELSLNSMVGISSPSTMKLMGTIHTAEVVVLIDSGASQNFFSEQLVHRLGLLSAQTESYGVLTGGGLTGDPGLGCSAISLKSLLRAVKAQGEGILVEYNGLQSMEKLEGVASEVPQSLLGILNQFPQVFEDPQGLPPTRGRAHEINLESGAKAVSVRPFRYPQTQKAEIEKQVTVMLAAGIIQESRSPFSSHVLLVKKKDGSWRFCIDYRAPKQVASHGFMACAQEYQGSQRIFRARWLLPQVCTGLWKHIKTLDILIEERQVPVKEATVSFEQLKVAMSTVPVLALVDFEELFMVEYDASGIRLGAVLMQKQKHVAYFSQALTDRQKLKSVYERELMAIVFAIQKWRHYLLSRKFLVRTDQKSLKFLLEEPIQLEEINEEVERNPALKKIKEEVLFDSSTHLGYSLVQGRLLYNGKLVLPRESYLIKGMMSDIKTFVAECVVCQKHKYSTLAPSGLLQPLPIPTQVWEDISLDFVEGLPKSEGFDAILVVVDRLTKYAHFIKLQHPFGAKEIAAVFIQEIVRLHGYPRTMVSDRDTLFTGMFWTELFRLAGTSLNFSTAYHPHTDGQTEVTNRGLETILGCFTSDKPKKWAAYLPWAEFCYNSSYHSTIQMTPFKALYGRDPPSLLKFEDGSTTNANLETQLKERDAMIVIVKQNILKAQQLMKHRADGHRREVEFKLAIGSSFQPAALPPHLTAENVLEAEPEAHMGVRINALSGQQEVFIKWKGLPDCDSTWEWVGVIQEQFPEFDLEDKALFKAAGIVTEEGGIIIRLSCFFRVELHPFFGAFRDITAVSPSSQHSPTSASLTNQTNFTKTDGERISTGTIVGISVSIVVIIIIIIILGLLAKRYAILCWRRKSYQDIDLGQSVHSLQFDLKTIEAATNKFSERNKIGEGGFGEVFKGTLPNGTEVAVKRLSRASDQGAPEFKNEEFVPNKSLDYFLFDATKQGQLDWMKRLNIILGITRGILYLHQDSRLTIIHRDLKASNILLDADMIPKIADFGMARIFGIEQTRDKTCRIAGTYGYMSPEYAMHGQISMKSDVYSFGVLVLEIICGRKNSSFHNSESGAENIVTYAWRLWKNRTPLVLVDPIIAENYQTQDGFYYNGSIGPEPNRVYATGMCMPGADAKDCSDCIKSASDDLLKTCENQTDAYSWPDDPTLCHVRYSNTFFSGSADLYPPFLVPQFADLQSNLTEFTTVWETLISGMIAAASVARSTPSSSNNHYKADVAPLTKFQNIYALMHCTPDISPGDCDNCLRQNVIDYQSCCKKKHGVFVRRPSCYFRWELHVFSKAFERFTWAPPPSPHPAPPTPLRQPLNTENSSRKISTITIIAAIVLIVIIFSVSLACRFYRKRKSYQEVELNQTGIKTVRSLKYDFKTIEAATNKFSESNKIGRGGFGDVFKVRWLMETKLQ